jgi:vancomycin resistance protein YoaR
MGKRTIQNGFKPALIIINGKYEEGLGGGVCQLSSTLYNAADKAGLKIVERHAHTKQVAYVPRGRDAAISYGHMDLKFKNTKDFPIVIKVQVKNGKVYTSIYKA